VPSWPDPPIPGQDDATRTIEVPVASPDLSLEEYTLLILRMPVKDLTPTTGRTIPGVRTLTGHDRILSIRQVKP